MDGDDFNEPVADATRSILDGHVVLTRDLADAGHYPAIDVLQSVSRLKADITDAEIQAAGGQVISYMSTFKKVEDMVNIGAYSAGSNPEIDKALAMQNPINTFLRQQVNEHSDLQSSNQALLDLNNA